MPSLLVKGTAQALVLGGISNILAQIISAQQAGVWKRKITLNQPWQLTAVATILF